MECVIVENGGELMVEQMLPPEITELLMQRFGEELFAEELDRKLDGVLERLQENADTLICGFARECSTGGWKGLLEEVRGSWRNISAGRFQGLREGLSWNWKCPMEGH